MGENKDVSDPNIQNHQFEKHFRAYKEQSKNHIDVLLNDLPIPVACADQNVANGVADGTAMITELYKSKRYLCSFAHLAIFAQDWCVRTRNRK